MRWVKNTRENKPLEGESVLVKAIGSYSKKYYYFVGTYDSYYNEWISDLGCKIFRLANVFVVYFCKIED